MNRTTPPFVLGGVVDGDAPPPAKFEVVEPDVKGPIPATPRQKVACMMRLIVPEGGALPTSVSVFFRDAGGGPLGNYPMKPASKEGNAYTLGYLMRAPIASGKYALIYETTYLVRPHPKIAGAPAPNPVEHRSSVKAAEVEVSGR